MDYTVLLMFLTGLTLLAGISLGLFVMLIGIGHQLECIVNELRKRKGE